MQACAKHLYFSEKFCIRKQQSSCKCCKEKGDFTAFIDIYSSNKSSFEEEKGILRIVKCLFLTRKA